MSLFGYAACLTGILFPASFAHSEDAASFSISSGLTAYSRSANLPELSDSRLARLADGETVVVVAGSAQQDDDIDSLGVVGIRIVEAPKLLVWLSLFDGQHEPHSRYTRATLERGTDGSWVRYQHVNLPWPFRDRHWVIDATKNRQLAAESDGAIWEHRWQLHEDGQSLAQRAYEDGLVDRLKHRQLERSVYLRANRGAWTLLELDADTTLIVAHVSVDLGGLLPAGLVRRYTRSQLAAGLDALAETSANAHSGYDADPVLYDGHGKPVTVADVRRTVDRWEASLRLAQAE